MKAESYQAAQLGSPSLASPVTAACSAASVLNTRVGLQACTCSLLLMVGHSLEQTRRAKSDPDRFLAALRPKGWYAFLALRGRAHARARSAIAGVRQHSVCPEGKQQCSRAACASRTERPGRRRLARRDRASAT